MRAAPFMNRYRLTGCEIDELVKIYSAFKARSLSVVCVEKIDPDSTSKWRVSAYGKSVPLGRYYVETYTNEPHIVRQ